MVAGTVRFQRLCHPFPHTQALQATSQAFIPPFSRESIRRAHITSQVYGNPGLRYPCYCGHGNTKEW